MAPCYRQRMLGVRKGTPLLSPRVSQPLAEGLGGDRLTDSIALSTEYVT